MGDLTAGLVIVAAVLAAVAVCVASGWVIRRLTGRRNGDVIPRVCPGPLVWYEVPAATPDGTDRALLECGASGCTYLIASTSNEHDVAHRYTPLTRVPT